MKHRYTLTKKNTCLVIVDMQEKFVPVIPGFAGLSVNAAKLVLAFQMFKMPVLVTEQYPRGLGVTVEKIRKQFTMMEVIEKMELSAADNPEFVKKINKLKVDTFVVCGIETHVCINQTVLGLLAMGKNVHVVADAVGSRKPFDHSVALRKMETAGALITTTEIVLFELAERAGTEEFKHIQLLVKGPQKKQSCPPPVPKHAIPILEGENDSLPVAKQTVALPESVKAKVPVEHAENDVLEMVSSEALQMTEEKTVEIQTVVETSPVNETVKPQVDHTTQTEVIDLSSLVNNNDVSEQSSSTGIDLEKDIADLDALMQMAEHKSGDDKTEQEKKT